MNTTVNPTQIETHIETDVGEAAHDGLVQRIKADLAESLAAPGRAGRIWIGSLLAVVAAGLAAYTYQLANGLKVTAMREYISWGVYITNFVFFIGISHAGTLISAILRVTNAEWRRPITRMAEAITVFALMVGAPMVLIDLGRVDRVLNIIIHGRLSSPLLWDVFSICTYIAGSLLYLYVAMIPDVALLLNPTQDGQKASLRQRLYRALSLGYRGTPEQRRLLEKALHAMAVIIIPVAISVHTVVSWIFGMTLRPGWHSTIFGPYFVIGAIFSGTAALLTAMAIFRKVYGLERYLTFRQFKSLATLLLALNLLYLYFTLSEYLTVWYGAESTDKRLLDLLMGSGAYGITFWAMLVFGLFLPLILLIIPNKGSIGRIVVASILINIAMWIKRYLIIVPTLMTPYIPAEAGGVIPHYYPTWVEWTVSAGGLAFFLLLFTLFAKVFPIISIWETVEGVEELGAKKIGVDLEPEPAQPCPACGNVRPAVAPAMALVILTLFLGAQGVFAAEPAVPKPRPEIALTTSVEEGKKVIVAKVTLNGKPVEGAKVAVQVQRTFGQITLGTEDTLDDGTVAVPFPADLPGGAAGQIQVVAEIKSPPEYASTRAQATFDGALQVQPESNPFPRALWSPKAPLALILTIFTLLSIVWITYTYVIVQLIKIKKGAKA